MPLLRSSSGPFMCALGSYGRLPTWLGCSPPSASSGPGIIICNLSCNVSQVRFSDEVRYGAVSHHCCELSNYLVPG